jgi:two-component system chemotaxis response regulator CheB
VIRLLIVDDSPLMRRLLSGIFTGEGDFLVDVARDGIEAIEKLHAFTPDVITLDVQMPRLDGLACLDRIMVERPVPVVMLSSLTAKGAEATLEALALGAVDVVAKPAGPVSLEIEQIAPALVETVRAAAGAKVSRAARLAERLRLRSGRVAAVGESRRPPPPASARPAPEEERLVLIGASTGGPPALEAVLRALPGDFPWPIVIAQHMPASFTGALARRLDRLCDLAIEEVSRPVPLLPGHAYIGRGDADLVVTRRRGVLCAMATPESSAHRWHPSVDRLVDSAMAQLGPERLVGVLMTGMGDDGARELARLHEAGGITIAESEDSAVVWGMPGSLARLGGAGRVLPLSRIAHELRTLAQIG